TAGDGSLRVFLSSGGVTRSFAIVWRRVRHEKPTPTPSNLHRAGDSDANDCRKRARGPCLGINSMRLGKSSTVALLLFLVSLNLILRYPRTPHELDYDGFVFHGMIRFLVSDGYATWIIHPLSYFGLYPLSHPGGGLFLVASLTQVSGIPIEGSILLLDFVVVVVGLLGAFALSMELRKNEL